MPNANVLNQIHQKSDQLAVDQLLIKSGFAPTRGHAFGSPAVNISPDIMIIAFPIDPKEISNVTNIVNVFGPIGTRIIGIWLPSAAGDQTPSYMTNYGYSMFCLHSPSANDALQGIKPAWENSDCEQRAKQKLKRHC